MIIKSIASGSKGNCYLISDGDTPLLLECGIPIQKIRKGVNFGLQDIAACLVTHEHSDHSKAILDVLRAGINIYTSIGTKTALNISHHRLIGIEPLKQLEIGTMSILPFEVQHDAAQPLGYLIYSRRTREKLLFITDSYYVEYNFKGLTHIMFECNYADDILETNIQSGIVHPALRNRIVRSHFSLQEVKRFLQANDLTQVQQIYLIHLSDTNSDEARFKREIQELTGKEVITC